MHIDLSSLARQFAKRSTNGPGRALARRLIVDPNGIWLIEQRPTDHAAVTQTGDFIKEIPDSGRWIADLHLEAQKIGSRLATTLGRQVQVQTVLGLDGAQNVSWLPAGRTYVVPALGCSSLPQQVPTSLTPEEMIVVCDQIRGLEDWDEIQ